MNHPIVEQIIQTGYPAGMSEGDHPIEDIFGDEIIEKDLYFIFKNGDVVLAENLGHYAIQNLGADELEA